MKTSTKHKETETSRLLRTFGLPPWVEFTLPYQSPDMNNNYILVPSGEGPSKAVDYELAPTPRVHHYADSRFDPGAEPPWLAAAAASRESSDRVAKPPLAESALAWPPERMDAAEDDFREIIQ